MKTGGIIKTSHRREQKPDAQGFDEIQIKTVPRYKTSGLSGDEWRISAEIKFLRKGKVIHEAYNHNIENAIHMLYAHYAQAHDEGKMFFAGEGDFCDQEGCSEKATVVYRLKKKYCKEYGHEPTVYKPEESPIRMFCERHSKRGDCGLDDSDANYELLEGFVSEPNEKDVKPAVFGGTIVADSLN